MTTVGLRGRHFFRYSGGTRRDKPPANGRQGSKITARSPEVADSMRNGLERLIDDTNERFVACLRAGGHKPSPEHVMRVKTGGSAEFIVCRRCGVPYLPPAAKTVRKEPLDKSTPI